MARKKRKEIEGAPQWMLTYSDLVTQLLCFFVLLISVASFDKTQADVRMVLSAFEGLGYMSGGKTFQPGKLAELGNTVESLPSSEAGRALGQSTRQAISLFQAEVKSRKVRITFDERGLVISLAGDAFFRRGSAELDIESSREILQKMASFLASPELANRKFRIEGHTDSSPTNTNEWPTNWELSTDRATNVLHYLVDYGAGERQFQVAGFADTVPLVPDDTPEGQAYNRRVDLIVLSSGHL